MSHVGGRQVGRVVAGLVVGIVLMLLSQNLATQVDVLTGLTTQ